MRASINSAVNSTNLGSVVGTTMYDSSAGRLVNERERDGSVAVNGESMYDGLGKPLAEGIAIEAALGRGVISDAQSGAARFASGAGRGGKFGTE